MFPEEEDERGEAQEDMEGEDEVVRELDVFVSDNIELYLMQFPLRPVHAPHQEINGARWKNKHQILELSLNHPVMQEPLKMCSTTVAQGTNLAIGVLKDDALHISPLREVLQMRPSFKDLLPPARGGEDGGTVSGGAFQSDDDDEDFVQEKPVLQRVGLLKKKDTDKSQSACAQSFTHQQAQEESEPWVRLQVRDVDSVESDQAFGAMYYEDSKY